MTVPALSCQMPAAIYTFCFAESPIASTLRALWRPPVKQTVPGLIHAECMAGMELGAPVFSPRRLQLRRLAMFAAWESSDAIDRFMSGARLGRLFAAGWHVRMSFLRRWGSIRELDGLTESTGEASPEEPVIAVTIARMRLTEVPRFIRWGKPAEELVRDHPGAVLASAAMRLPRTVCTFSVWNTQKEMLEMVRGHSRMERPDRHAAAMRERNRRDFHFEFTTLRFRPISEHGTWEGRSHLVPKFEKC